MTRAPPAPCHITRTCCIALAATRLDNSAPAPHRPVERPEGNVDGRQPTLDPPPRRLHLGRFRCRRRTWPAQSPHATEGPARDRRSEGRQDLLPFPPPRLSRRRDPLAAPPPPPRRC